MKRVSFGENAFAVGSPGIGAGWEKRGVVGGIFGVPVVLGEVGSRAGLVLGGISSSLKDVGLDKKGINTVLQDYKPVYAMISQLFLVSKQS